MRLFILLPLGDLNSEGSPWNPWYDKMFGIIVQAETEYEAREIAAENAEGEQTKEWNPWLVPELTSCVELKPGKEAGVILSDMRYA